MFFDAIFKIVSADGFACACVCSCLWCEAQQSPVPALLWGAAVPPVQVCAHTAASCCSQHCYRLLFLKPSASYTLSDASCVRDLIDICFLLFLPTFYPFFGQFGCQLPPGGFRSFSQVVVLVFL